MNEQNARYWQVKDYTIRQIMPATGFVAVFAMDSETSDKCWLESVPIDLLAVVDVVEKTLEGKIGAVGREVGREEYTDVVGLELDDGFFQVVNDASNFAGLQRVGEDINDAIGSLHVEYRRKLERREQGDDE